VHSLIAEDTFIPPVSVMGSSLDELLTPVVDEYGNVLAYAWKDKPELTGMLLAFNEIPSC
jgi:hypothetical protein